MAACSFLRHAASLITLLLVTAFVAPAVAATLDGRFYGVEAAEGAELILEARGDTVSGRLIDRGGQAQAFEAARVDGGAEARIVLDGREVLLRLDPLDFGALASVLPVGETEAAPALFTFVRRELSLPERPEGYLPPPARGTRATAALSFLRSYQFWPADAVRRGYEALSSRHRTLIALFPAVQLDLIWKLCRAAEPGRALGHALRGQGVGCGEVRETIAAAQATGRFDAYKAEVATELDILARAVRCADGYVESKAACDASAREIGRAATSLETAATVLSRYR
ncbi:MAG: hypothetical protein ACFBWO_11925 [Paracoccaceae bacterium]